MIKQTMKRIAIVTAILALTIGAAWAQLPGQQPGMQAPMPQSFDEALATVVIGDVQGFTNNIGGIAALVSPMTNGDAIKAQIGQFVGDPMLAGLPAGSGILLAWFPPNTSIVFAEVAPAQIDAYAQAAQMYGYASAKGNGLLVLGKSPAAANAGAAMASGAAALLKGSGDSSILATVHMDRVMAAYGPMLQMSLGMLAMQATSQMQQAGADPQAIQKAQLMTQMQLGVLQQVLAQTNQLLIGLAAPATGIDLQIAIKPKPGTDLAALMAAPVKPADDLLVMLPANGAIRGSAGLNADALRTFMSATIDKVLPQMPADEKLKKEVRDTYMASIDGPGSNGAAFDIFYPGKAIVSGVSVSRLTGTADPIAAIEKSLAQMKDKGVFNNPQAGMDMDMQFQRNVRKHAGTDIHQMRMTFTQKPDAVAAMPQQAAFMQALFGPEGGMLVEFAIIGDKVVQTLGGVPIEPAIDAVKAGRHPEAAPIQAAEIIGAGWQGYFALNAAKALELTMPLIAAGGGMPANTLQSATQALANASPLVAGYRITPRGAQGKLVVPTNLIQIVSQAIMAARMQQMQQQMQPAQ